MLGVARPDFEEVAVVAGDVMHFQHFGTLGERVRDRFVSGSLCATDRDERQHPLLDRIWVDERRVAFYNTPALQLPYPLEHCRGRQSDGSGNVCL